MSDFLNRMKSAAKADLKTIVLPEGEDPRTIEAATVSYTHLTLPTIA